MDCTNKTVPVYVVNGSIKRRGLYYASSYLLKRVLLNYLFRKWFAPHRSEIEYGRFLARPIFPCAPACRRGAVASPGLVEDIVILHTSICTRVEATLCDLRNISFRYAKPRNMPEERWAQFLLHSHEPDRSELHILQPLFRAVAITLLYDDYDDRGSTTMGDLPVLLILTGEESGLSAPITFDAIEDNLIAARIDGSSGHGRAARTTFDTAIDFVMALERREIKTFGLRLKPARTARIVDSWYAEDSEFYDYSEIADSRRWILEEAERLGWKEEWKPLRWPSSGWVSDSKRFRIWSGLGAECSRGWLKAEREAWPMF
ncbi:hypothetical protein B0T22DRAFT_456589 [Podospora appendiculata]|uniref:Uncharacterized protein n=1 Tax=Podospora appendiculata TaxID=314037 RepID=A0AAE0X712_9PEZI|nr:hypothetical protein B0T22DRAFT_456589 [Podospora appendiculata]